MDEVSDRELMTRYADGDARAFETLYARHKTPLYRFLRQRCFDPQTADDVFQEVWTKVIRARTQYEPTAKFSTWLYQVARNVYVDHVRHVKRRVQLVTDSDDALSLVPSATTTADEVHGDQIQRAIDNAVAGLPEEQREAFLLHQFAGLTLPQIAEITDVGRETVKSRLRYAVAKLRDALPSPDDAAKGVSA